MLNIRNQTLTYIPFEVATLPKTEQFAASQSTRTTESACMPIFSIVFAFADMSKPRNCFSQEVVVVTRHRCQHAENVLVNHLSAHSIAREVLDNLIDFS